MDERQRRNPPPARRNQPRGYSDQPSGSEYSPQGYSRGTFERGLNNEGYFGEVTFQDEVQDHSE